MANRTIPINQEVVLDIRAKTSNIESSIKNLLQKLQGTTLSDSFTKSYVNSLQKVLDKSQELKKIVTETNAVNSKTTSEWTSSYNKLVSELTRALSRLESNSLDFKDLVGYDENAFKRLKDDLKKVQQIQKDIYSSSNISSKVTTPKAIDKDISRDVTKNISDEQKVNALLDIQVQRINEAKAIQEQNLVNIQKEISYYKTLDALIEDITNNKGKITNAQKASASGMGLDASQLTTKSAAVNYLSGNKKDISEIAKQIQPATEAVDKFNAQLQEVAQYRSQVASVATQLGNDFREATQPVLSAERALEDFKRAELAAAQVDLGGITDETKQVQAGLQSMADTTDKATDNLVKMEQRQSFFSDMQMRITQLFGLANAFQLLRRFINESLDAIKELDAAFTKIAVVTDFTTGDLWKSFDTYNTMAQRLGVTTTDAIETSALYYQQGLDTADVMTLTTETIKMAQIANMDFTEATQAMTAAIRGFKMEMQDAGLVTDVYSALAAEAAVDTQDLAIAISKVASIAGSAGLSFENTSAFLTQIIETTQEAAETAGTALKTIIARFTELTKDPATLVVEVEGEQVSANKIEEALATAKVELRDATGEFRDLDTVFLELSGKWDSLSRNTQRYIATVAAGSRQQSRFIAMMDNYERTMELVDIANTSAGASQIQFAKTLDSVGAKLNKLTANFQKLIGNLVENQFVKDFLDLLNEGLSYLVNVADRGVVAFATMIVTLGVVIKNALSLIIGAFSNMVRQWESTKTKISNTILRPIIKPQVDLSEWEIAKAKVTNTPTPSPVVVEGTGANGTTGPVSTSLRNNIMKSAASGLAAGLLMGVATGDWKTALTTTLISSVTSALGNPAIMAAIKGSKFGGAVAGIGGALVKAVPWAAVAAAAIYVGAQVYKWIDPLQKSEKKIVDIKNELNDLQNELQEVQAKFLAEKEVLDSLTDNIDEFKELSKSVTLTADEQDRLNELSSKLATQFPTLISGYDEAGNAIINQRADWEEIVKLQKESTQLAKEQYAGNVLETSFLQEDLLDEQFNAAELRVEKYNSSVNGPFLSDDWWKGWGSYFDNWFAGNISFFGETKDALKEAETIVANEAAHMAEMELSSIQIANALKQVAEADLSALEAAFNFDLAQQTSVFGQSFVADRTKEIQEFLAGVADADKNAALQDLDSYNKLSTESKKFLEDIGKAGSSTVESLQKLDAQGIIDILNRASTKISTNIFDSLKDLDTTYKDDLTKLLGNTSHLTVAAFTEQLEDILGEENPLLNTVVDWFSETNKATNTYLAASFGNTIIQSLLQQLKDKGGSFSELIAAMAQGKGATYLIELGIDPRSAGTFTQEVQNFLDSQDYTYVVDIVGTANYDQMVQTYGQGEAASGVEFLQGTDNETAQALAGGDVTTVTGAQQTLADLVNNVGVDYDIAKGYVLGYAEAVGTSANVNEDTITSFVGLNSVLNKTRSVDKYAQTLKNLNGNFLDLDHEGIQTLIDEVPGASEVLKDLRDGAIDGAEASKLLEKALLAKDLYEVQGAITDVNTAIEDYGIDSYETAEALNTLGLTQEQWLNEDIQLSIIALLNGNTDAFWDQTEAIWAEKAALDAVSTTDLSGMANQIATATNLSTNDFQVLTGSMMEYANVLQNLGIGTIKTATIDVPSTIPEGLPGAGTVTYFKKTISYFEYSGGGRRSLNTYNPKAPKGGGGGGKESDYETKVDPYYNEIQAIENLNKTLDDLAEKREAGDLTPEEYKQNIQDTIKYYKELQDKLHQYNEMLRKDQKKLTDDINKAGYGEALKVVNGQLIANRDLIKGLSHETQEEIDDQIDSYEELSDAILENSDSWKEAQQAQIELLKEAREAYVELEERIIDILIEQDQKEIEKTQEKYDALKKADDDYLEALRDNIDKRRKARDKEESFSDLAKKEKRLALLKRDTSGIYAAEILSLEEEIAQQRQDLADQETDDMVSNLEDQASTRAEAYDEELEELNNLQKDKEESMEYYNQRANEIMAQGYDQLMGWFMQNDTEFLTATTTAQQQYIESWRNTVNEASMLSDLISATGGQTAAQAAAQAQAAPKYTELAGIKSLNPTASGGDTYASAAKQIQERNAVQAMAWYQQNVASRTSEIDPRAVQLIQEIIKLKYQYEGVKFTGFSAGGLADFTGLAMVHGSTTDPEAFLSASDTRNFQTLAQLLSSAITYNGTSGETPENGATTVMGDINITIEVAELGDDYDVEQMVEKVKQEIVNSSSYRNVNLISKVR